MRWFTNIPVFTNSNRSVHKEHKQDEAKTKLQELKTAGDEAWEAVKTGADGADAHLMRASSHWLGAMPERSGARFASGQGAAPGLTVAQVVTGVRVHVDDTEGACGLP